jgi:hypothetical protein
MRAGDRRSGADILAEASRLTVRIGENASAGQDILRHGRQAVALARAGLTIAQDTATPALATKLHAMEARGFALLGDAREARHAVAAAQRCYESVSPEDAALFYIVNGFGGTSENVSVVSMIPSRPSRSAPWRCAAASPGRSAACA